MNLSVTKKRILAIFLSILMILTSSFMIPMDAAFAQENDGVYASSTDASEELEATEETVYQSELPINFTVVEEARFNTPADNKYIVVDMGDGSVQFESAEIVLLNQTTGERYTSSPTVTA